MFRINSFRGLSIADASLAQSTARPPDVWLPHVTRLCKGLDLWGKRLEDPLNQRLLSRIVVSNKGVLRGFNYVASFLQPTPGPEEFRHIGNKRI